MNIRWTMRELVIRLEMNNENYEENIDKSIYLKLVLDHIIISVWFFFSIHKTEITNRCYFNLLNMHDLLLLFSSSFFQHFFIFLCIFLCFEQFYHKNNTSNYIAYYKLVYYTVHFTAHASMIKIWKIKIIILGI